MTEASIFDRLAAKGLDGQFLWELQHGYELSPRENEGILEAVKLEIFLLFYRALWTVFNLKIAHGT